MRGERGKGRGIPLGAGMPAIASSAGSDQQIQSVVWFTSTQTICPASASTFRRSRKNCACGSSVKRGRLPPSVSSETGAPCRPSSGDFFKASASVETANCTPLLCATTMISSCSAACAAATIWSAKAASLSSSPATRLWLCARIKVVAREAHRGFRLFSIKGQVNKTASIVTNPPASAGQSAQPRPADAPQAASTPSPSAASARTVIRTEV